MQNLNYHFLKRYFEANRDKLPDTLENRYMKINDVKKYVSLELLIAENVFKKLGKGANNNAPARAAVEGLRKVYKMLQNEN